MKLKTLLLVLLIITSFLSFSQECGTFSPSVANEYPDNPMARNADSGSSFCVNIKFHIVRNTDGTNGFGGTPSTDTNLIISKLNENFNEHGIYFNKIGVNFIDNSNFLIIDGESEFNSLTQTDNDPNAINYYVVQWLHNIVVPSAAGVAGIGTNRLAVIHPRIYQSPSSHEMGHILDLHHTHRGSPAEPNGCAEAINGSNCHDCGDLVCDTPADANTENTGGYSPDLTNIMSFYVPRDHFTSGQGYRMRQALRHSPVLQNVVANSCAISNIFLDGGDTICTNQPKTFTLQNLPNGVTASWLTSNNLTTLNNTTTEISVNLGSSSSQTVNITAAFTINDITYYISRNLTNLPLPSASSITLESFRSEPIYSDRWTNITARYDGLIDVYNNNHRFTWQWVVPSHQIRQNSPHYSYIHVKPVTTMSSVYIKTRAENECGCSDWKGKWFTVQTPPSNCTSCPTTGGEVHY